jgi:hypothetical protein
VNDAMVGFVTTKPLQVMTASVIARQLVGTPALLVVVPTFADGARIVGRLSTLDTGFADVRSGRSRVASILQLGARGASRIFVDSDMGLKTPLAMRLVRLARRGVRFSVYEEGVSLVTPFVRDRPNPLLARLGATLNLGEAAVVDEVWTYTPELVRPRLPTKRLHRIETGLEAFVASQRSFLTDAFWPDHARDVARWAGDACCVYLSSWEVDPRAVARLAETRAFTICKPHPHIRQGVALPDGIDQVLHPSIPAELVLMELAKRFGEVEVLHHASSAAAYVTAPNVRFVDLPDPEPPAATAALDRA